MSDISNTIKVQQDQDREPSRSHGWGKSKDEIIKLEIKQSMM
jgi:hypothetical protein